MPPSEQYSMETACLATSCFYDYVLNGLQFNMIGEVWRGFSTGELCLYILYLRIIFIVYTYI